MDISERKTVRIDRRNTPSAVRHPVKAARLLYSVPRFVLRGPIYMVFVILVAAIAYSCWARKDILVVAPLTLERETVTVVAVGGGQVGEIRIRENGFVKAGEVFLRVQEQTRAAFVTEQESFDSKIGLLADERQQILFERNHLIAKLRRDLSDLTRDRRRRMRELGDDIEAIGRKLEAAELERALLAKEYGKAEAEYLRVVEKFDERRATRRQRDAAERVKDRKFDAMTDTRIQIEELTSNRAAARRRLKAFRAQHGVLNLEKEIRQVEGRRDWEVKRLTERIAELERKRVQSQQLVEGVTYRENLTEYRSTFDGLVTEIHVARGRIVAPGAPLITYVKRSASLEGRVLVRNMDIGKIKRLQNVKIKYHAFPYQEYGIPEGTIYSVARGPGGVAGSPSMYVVRVALKEEVIRKGGNVWPLEIGLEGMAEIKTGEKRFIELFFKPVSRFFGEEE